MKSEKPFFKWFILLCGMASITWTVILHGKLYGYSALPRAGSTIALVAASIIIILVSLIIETSLVSRKPNHIKRIGELFNNDWLWLAVLIPLFIFSLFFLLSSHSLRPLPTFIRQVSIPFLVFLLVLFSFWIVRIIANLINKNRTNALQDSRLIITRVNVQKGLWNLFVFLALANALGSILIAITQKETFFSIMSSRFLVENEASIYTYVSGFLLLMISIGFGIQGNHTKITSLRITWSLLGILFLVLSVDEIISVHEEIISALRLTGFGLTASTFAYLLPIAASAILILFLVIRSFIRHRVQQWWLFFLGISLFIFGGVFIESITEALEFSNGEGMTPLLLIKALLFLEEGMELIGTYAILFFILNLFFGKNYQLSIVAREVPIEEKSTH